MKFLLLRPLQKGTITRAALQQAYGVYGCGEAGLFIFDLTIICIDYKIATVF